MTRKEYLILSGLESVSAYLILAKQKDFALGYQSPVQYLDEMKDYQSQEQHWAETKANQ